jgi:hypothetical protein
MSLMSGLMGRRKRSRKRSSRLANVCRPRCEGGMAEAFVSYFLSTTRGSRPLL